MRYDETAEANGAEEGKFEGCLPGVVVKGLELAKGGAAGIIDEDIDLSKGFGRGGDHIRYLTHVCDVDGDGHHPAFAESAQFCRCRFEGGGLTCPDDHVRA